MKIVKFAAFLTILAAGSAFAQSNSTSGDTPAPANPVALSNSVSQSGSPAQATEGATSQKTRAQVYAELVRAEKDGQLAYLNSTVYKNP